MATAENDAAQSFPILQKESGHHLGPMFLASDLLSQRWSSFDSQQTWGLRKCSWVAWRGCTSREWKAALCSPAEELQAATRSKRARPGMTSSPLLEEACTQNASKFSADGPVRLTQAIPWFPCIPCRGVLWDLLAERKTKISQTTILKIKINGGIYGS